MSEAPARTFWEVPEAYLDAAWREKRVLGGVVRELVALVVTTDAPREALALAAEHARAAVAALSSHPKRTFRELFPGAMDADLARVADRATLVGPCNPVAPPMRLRMDGERAIAEVEFGPAMEGGPGMVHGGIVAAAIDQCFGYLQTRRRVTSFTGSLTVRYPRPTPIETPLVFEAWVAKTEGRRTHLAARCTAGDRVTAEGEALFVEVGEEQMRSMFQEEARRQDVHRLHARGAKAP